MTILTVKHLTTYSYAAPVRLGEHHAKLERSCGYAAKKIPPPVRAGGIVATAAGALA